MKLRVLNNSLRLRLTRSEVDAVCHDGLVKGHVPFSGANSFSYVLESSPATVSPEAHISNNVLTIRIPEAEIKEWGASEQVSICADQLLEDGGALKILVEKDFKCLAPREDEDESDMYPHPEADQETG